MKSNKEFRFFDDDTATVALLDWTKVKVYTCSEDSLAYLRGTPIFITEHLVSFSFILS